MSPFLNKLLSPKEMIFICFLFFISFLGLIFLISETTNLIKSKRVIYAGTITEGLVGNPKIASPLGTHNQVDKDLNKLLYSPLIQNVADDKFDLVLAESVSKSQDGLTYRVKLKDKIFFQNGKEILTDDAIFSLENTFIDRDFILEKIDSRSFNLKIKKNTKENIFDKLSVSVVSKNTKAELTFSKDVVGSGFFRIKDLFKDNEGNITKIYLTRFDNGLAKIPYIKNYNVNFYKDDASAFTALQNKTIDILGGTTGTNIAKIKDDTSFNIETSDLPNNIALFTNVSNNKFLQDQNLRKILNSSIDRASLVNQVLGGFGKPEENILGENNQQKVEVGTGFILENGVLYSSTKKTDSKVEKVLKSPVSIKITTIDNKELVETANFVKTSWEKIGVQTSVEIIDRKNVANVVKDRNFEILLFGFSIKDKKDYYSFFHSKERTYPKLNIANFANKNVDQILENDSSSDYLSKLSSELENTLPVIILYKPQYIFASRLLKQPLINSSIKNEEDKYLNINNWYTEAEYVLNIWNKFQILKTFINKLDILIN